jgi:hypothetical protein
MDPRVVVYPSRLVEFSQRLGNQNMRTLNEMADFYEGIELGCQVWDNDFRPKFIVFDSAHVQPDDYSLQMNVRSRMNLAEYAALGGHVLILENAAKFWILSNRKNGPPRLQFEGSSSPHG